MIEALCKYQLIFIHIPKTAGVTLYQIIQDNYSTADIFLIDAFRGIEAIEEFKELPEKVRYKFRVIMGHVGIGIHNYMAQPTTYITILREPVDRLISSFYYIKFKEKKHFLHPIVKNLELEEYITAKIWDGDDNAIVRALARLDQSIPFGGLTEKHLESAKHNLNHYFKLFGFLEYYDDFLSLLRVALGWNYGPINKQNVNPKRPVRENLSTSTLRAVESCNQLDNELIQFAKGIYWDKINSLLDEVHGKGKFFQIALPEHSHSFFSNVNNSLDDTEQARELFQQGYGLSSEGEFEKVKDIKIIKCTGEAYIQDHKPQETINCYQQILMLGGDDAEPYLKLGDAFLTMGNLPQALVNYHNASNRQPELVAAYIGIGNVYKFMEKYDAADRFYHLALSFDPGSFDALINLGNINMKRDNIEQAVENFCSALMIKPDDYHIYNGLGYALYKLGSFNQAIEMFQKAILLNSEYSDALCNLGRIYQITNQTKKQQDVFRKVISLLIDGNNSSLASD